MRSRTLELIAMLLGGLVLLLYGIKGAPGAEIRLPDMVPSWVGLTGKIEPGDDIVFKQKTKAMKGHVTLWLSSQGGDLAATLQIATFIHMNQWTTSVGFGNRCNSGCAIIWLAGVPRRLHADALIGVHSAAITGSNPPKRNDLGNGVAFGFLRSIGISEEIIDRFYRTEPGDMDYIDYSQALKAGLLDESPLVTKKKADRFLPQPIPLAAPTYPVTKIQKTFR